MTTIAYLYGEEFTERRNAILSHATKCGVRLFSFQTGYIGLSLKDALALARPDICIVEADYIDNHHLTPRDFPVPAIVCDLTPKHFQAGFTGIRHNRDSAASKAIDALLKLGFENYAFVGYHRPYEWSETRKNVFLETLKAKRKNSFILAPSRRQNLIVYMHALEKWLKQLPKPCGLFAVNDEIGEYVLTCAERIGIQVPESLAVVSIDNDTFRCENTVPPLASVPPDFAQSGRLAVDLALEMLAHPSKRMAPIEYHAGELIRRASLKTFRTHDVAAARALDYIQTHATEINTDTATIARIMNLPIRTAQIHFSRYAGHSIFEEIEECRFSTACALLRERSTKISELHRRCGYGCARALRNVFLKRTGKTPTVWRESHT